MTDQKLSHTYRLAKYKDAYPEEIHVHGRFWYDPRRGDYWHWCAKKKTIHDVTICNENRTTGNLWCLHCKAELSHNEFPAAFQLYLKLF